MGYGLWHMGGGALPSHHGHACAHACVYACELASCNWPGVLTVTEAHGTALATAFRGFRFEEATRKAVQDLRLARLRRQYLGALRVRRGGRRGVAGRYRAEGDRLGVNLPGTNVGSRVVQSGRRWKTVKDGESIPTLVLKFYTTACV